MNGGPDIDAGIEHLVELVGTYNTETARLIDTVASTGKVLHNEVEKLAELIRAHSKSTDERFNRVEERLTRGERRQDELERRLGVWSGPTSPTREPMREPTPSSEEVTPPRGGKAVKEE